MLNLTNVIILRANRPDPAYLPAMVSVVVPAHNEAQVLGRLLGQLAPAGTPDDVDVIVVANGCTDGTAHIAGGHGPRVRVLSIPVPSKREALLAGDQAATSFPRIYVDADVEIGLADIRALAGALARPGTLAAGPERVLALSGASWLVRWYYDVWARLPEVRSGLFGRGVIALSEAGYARVAGLPPLLADDLAASLVFGPGERVIVPGARVVVHVPRTFGDLLRRRVRAAMGVNQVEEAESAPGASARTRPGDLLDLVRAEPALAPKVALFLVVAVAARRRAGREVQRNQYSTWLRDESSRV